MTLIDSSQAFTKALGSIHHSEAMAITFLPRPCSFTVTHRVTSRLSHQLSNSSLLGIWKWSKENRVLTLRSVSLWPKRSLASSCTIRTRARAQYLVCLWVLSGFRSYVPMWLTMPLTNALSLSDKWSPTSDNLTTSKNVAYSLLLLTLVGKIYALNDFVCS